MVAPCFFPTLVEKASIPSAIRVSYAAERGSEPQKSCLQTASLSRINQSSPLSGFRIVALCHFFLTIAHTASFFACSRPSRYSFRSCL